MKDFLRAKKSQIKGCQNFRASLTFTHRFTHYFVEFCHNRCRTVHFFKSIGPRLLRKCGVLLPQGVRQSRRLSDRRADENHTFAERGEGEESARNHEDH